MISGAHLGMTSISGNISLSDSRGPPPLSQVQSTLLNFETRVFVNLNHERSLCCPLKEVWNEQLYVPIVELS